MTIEERWEALDRACGQRMKLDKPAARAALMAVLEEILQTWEGTLRKEGAVKLMALRARIAALGSRDGS